MGGKRFVVARGAARLLAAATRLAGVGEGTTLSGRVALAMDPTILERAGERIASILITGTNGKSTTTAIARGLARGAVVSNEGANLPFGVAGAIARGPLGAGVGVFEVDEAWVPRVARALRPRVLVWLNLSRDQLDRALEVRRLAERIAETAASCDVVVANAADPIVVLGALAFRRQVWVRPAGTWVEDAHACPRCASPLEFRASGWSCGGCGLAAPEASWWIDDQGRAHGPEGVFALEGAPPGSFNRFNALCAAIAVAELERTPVGGVLSRLGRGRAAPEGRFATWRVVGLPGIPRVTTLLAKNPAGVDALIELVEAGPNLLVAQLNAEVADGRDPSWIWDAPFERLSPRRIVVAGRRAADLALRLEVAGHEVVLRPDLEDALRTAAAEGPEFTYLGNYTAFWEAIRLLRRLGSIRDATPRVAAVREPGV
jgi:UDP-N-acetylmuramyl tripeptide synthase